MFAQPFAACKGKGNVICVGGKAALRDRTVKWATEKQSFLLEGIE